MSSCAHARRRYRTLVVRQILALVMLCAGDGSAALIGARWGARPSRKLPWSRHKSWPGTCAFVVASTACALVFAHMAFTQGWSQRSAAAQAPCILLVAAVAAGVESLPLGEGWDNATVFGSVIAATAMFGCR